MIMKLKMQISATRKPYFDRNKIVVSNKVSFSKEDFNILFAKKMLKK